MPSSPTGTLPEVLSGNPRWTGHKRTRYVPTFGFDRLACVTAALNSSPSRTSANDFKTVHSLYLKGNICKNDLSLIFSRSPQPFLFFFFCAKIHFVPPSLVGPVRSALSKQSEMKQTHPGVSNGLPSCLMHKLRRPRRIRQFVAAADPRERSRGRRHTQERWLAFFVFFFDDE